jgi:uncharacterized protein (DUF58 family)
MFALPPRLRPRRTIQPTREGWWCLLAAVGLGLAAINSGNNLLYLLESALLGLVIVSGILSEQSMRKVQVAPLLPEEIYAGRPALLSARVVNSKRRLPARSIVLEVVGTARLPLPWLRPGGERVVTWEQTFSSRGRQRLSGVRVTTRFPFGLFVKAGPRQGEAEVVVFPAVEPVDLERTGPAPGEEAAPIRRRGRGVDLYNLREYRSGDDPRLIHWRVSAKTGTTMVRELQADSTTDVRIVLRGTGARDRARLERGLSRAASLAVHCLRAGVALSLSGPGVLVSRGRGREHEREILTALALYDPAVAGPTIPDEERPRRQLVVDID